VHINYSTRLKDYEGFNSMFIIQGFKAEAQISNFYVARNTKKCDTLH